MSKPRTMAAGWGRPAESGLPGPVPAGAAGAARPVPAAAPVLEPPTPLAESFREVLAAGIHGLCFSPYLEGQAPGSQVGEAQIRARLERIRPHTAWIRTFSCTEGHEATPRIAHELGLKTLVGAWLGDDSAKNEAEIAGLIEVARAGHADLLAVGNEVLLREDLPEDELIGHIERVRAAAPGVPVGYVDAYYLFEQHPRVTAACDLLMANCYPFWEGCPLEGAIDYMKSMYRRTVAAAGGRPVLISETGWPNIGSPFQASVPSEAGALRYFLDTCRWGAEEDIPVFYFSAFDEAWKVGAEGDVGAFWGLWDKDGRIKYR